jgi:hypothetical protein
MTHPKTVEWQIDQLTRLCDSWAVQESRHVRGSFTSGDYVEYQLRRIFGPNRWSFTILENPTIVEVAETEGYAQMIGRLEVTFYDGGSVVQDAVGVWPLKASNVRNGGTLESTASERYETVLKAACTDALKAAAERIGSCFRPVYDERVRSAITRELSKRNGKEVDLEAGARALTGEDPEMLAGGNGNGEVNYTVLFNCEPTSTVFWTLANDMRDRGLLTHAEAIGIKNDATEIVEGVSAKTEWGEAVDKLREVFGGQ